MSKNKYKNNESLNKKVDNAFAENELRDELKDESKGDNKIHAPVWEERKTEYPDEDRELNPEERPHEMEAPSLDGDHFQRVDVWDNAQRKVRPTVDLHPKDHLNEGVTGEYEGHLPTDVLPGEKITDAYPAAGAGVAKPSAQRGFPWWWILLPLIILGIIYGLTRTPVNEENPPSSSTTSQIQMQIITAGLTDHLADFDLM